MQKIFLISMDSLFPMLFWGHTISFLFLIIYYNKGRFSKETNMLLFLIAARFCHMFYYFVASGRDILPDWLSVNLGNTLLFIGFYFEAHGILRVIKENTRSAGRMLNIALIFFIAAFNITEYISGSSGLRITMASTGVVAIMALPALRMFFSRDSGTFTKSAAIFHAIFLLLLLQRSWYGIVHQDVGILTTNILNSVTFLSLLLQITIALPSYIIIVKDHADDALLLMATTDRLTGATNRHAFLDAASAIHKSSRRFKTTLSVLFIDIDHFKLVNDQYGHAFGDTVLTRLSAIIDNCLRDSDLSCRYGGEEFVVLLSHSDSTSAKIVTDRIMNGVRQARFDEHNQFSFTISIGVASGVPDVEQNFDDVINLADEAMYRAKRSGRDRVVFYEMQTEINGEPHTLNAQNNEQTKSEN